MKSPGSEISESVAACDMGGVGAWLKKVRAERGETLDDVSKVTRIGRTYLEAIEEGAAEKLPSQAYTRGFIRLYAAHLGLPPEEAVAMINGTRAEPAVINAAPLLQSQIERNPPLPYRRGLIFSTLLALVLVAGYLLFKPTNSQTPKQLNRLEPAPVNQPEKTAAVIPEQSTLKNDPVPAANSEPRTGENAHSEALVLRLKAISEVKIHIIIDGSASQEYDLVAGDLVEWKAESTIALDLDNAASVEGELDGKPLKPFGAPGKAAHLVLKTDGTHQE